MSSFMQDLLEHAARKRVLNKAARDIILTVALALLLAFALGMLVGGLL